MPQGRGRLLALVAVVAGLAGLAWYMLQPRVGREIAVSVPMLSSQAQVGRAIFEQSCAPCHGRNGQGGETGPPLILGLYAPKRHADEAFYLAAERGIRQHHWSFGNMPPRPEVDPTQARAIVRFIREVQVANGIR